MIDGLAHASILGPTAPSCVGQITQTAVHALARNTDNHNPIAQFAVALYNFTVRVGAGEHVMGSGKGSRRFCASALMIGLMVVSSAGSARAALIDFEGIPATTATSGTPPPNTVLTNNFNALGVVFGLSGVSAGAVVSNASATAPSSGTQTAGGLAANGTITPTLDDDLYFSFVLPGTSTPAVTNSISFTIGDSGGDFDTFIIHSFNLANAEINTQNVSGAARFPVTINTPGVNRVRIEFTSDPFGYTMDDLSFTTPTPEPASALALCGVAAAAGALGRRRHRHGH
jgi:hypothetical protein